MSSTDARSARQPSPAPAVRRGYTHLLIRAVRRHVLPLAAAAGALASTAANAFDLTVHLSGMSSTQGSVMGAVYGSEAGWLKVDQALQSERAPAGADTVLVYRGLPAGRYAVSLFHDENGNGRLDTNPVGLPTERFGFSRDARGHFGPATFGDAAFELQQDMSITIQLR